MILGQMTYMTLFNALFLNNFIKNIRKLIIEKENQFSPTMKIIFKKVKTLWANMTSTFLNKKSSNDKQIRDKLKVFETRTAFKKSPTTKEKTHIKRLGSLKNKFKSFSNLRKNRDHLFNETAKNLFSSSQKKNFSRNESLISKPTVYFKKIDDFVESNNDLNKGIFQSFCNYVIQHHYFQNLMIAITCASLILLTINTPISDPRKSGIIACEILEKIFIALYILEFGLNVKAFGKKIFDRPFSQNCYDVLNVSISIASLFEDKYKSRTFETMKVIRVFRLINTGNNMFYHINLIMNSFVNALPNILKLLVFFLIFLYVFSLFAMKFLKGILFSCLNTNGQDILIEDKIDCFDYGGDWIEKDLNYDNILQSFFTLFVVTSSEGWSILM